MTVHRFPDPPEPTDSVELSQLHVRELMEIARLQMQTLRARFEASTRRGDTASLVGFVDEFERLSSAIRRGILLERRLANTVRTRPKAPTEAQIQLLRQARQHRAHQRVISELENVIRPIFQPPPPKS